MARRLPPLNALVVFEAAARHLSFTRASEELHVTQAAVSHQIKAIEDYLGVPLFHRLGRGQGLILTDAGRNYLPRISAALESIKLATDLLVQVRRKRVLNLAALDSFGAMWLLPRLSRFTSQHPDVDVRMTAADVESDGLARNLSDIEIRYGPGNWPQFEVTRFLTESIFPVCSPVLMSGSNPLLQGQDLRHHTLLHDVMTTSWRDWLTAAAVGGIDAERGPGFNHSNLVIQAAQMGNGVALGRGALVIDAIKSGSLVKPFALSLPAPYAYFVVTTKSGAADPLVQACRDWLVAEGQATQRDLDALVGSGESINSIA